MNIIFFNIQWMGFNIFLALCALVFAKLTFSIKNKFLKASFGILWIAFLPNTIYLLTDIIHFKSSFLQADIISKIIVSIQYLMLELTGVITFFYALSPFEHALYKKFRTKKNILNTTIVLVNFIIAFGIVLGRIQRINSWDLFTNLQRVLIISLQTLLSVKLMFYTILFGILLNLIYFSYKKLLYSRKK